jgi:hypothetical protein
MPMQYASRRLNFAAKMGNTVAQCGPRGHFGTLNSALPCPVHVVVTLLETEEVSKRAVEASL